MLNALQLGNNNMSDVTMAVQVHIIDLTFSSLQRECETCNENKHMSTTLIHSPAIFIYIL